MSLNILVNLHLFIYLSIGLFIYCIHSFIHWFFLSFNLFIQCYLLPLVLLYCFHMYSPPVLIILGQYLYTVLWSSTFIYFFVECYVSFLYIHFLPFLPVCQSFLPVFLVVSLFVFICFHPFTSRLYPFLFVYQSVYLKISQNSREKTSFLITGVSFLITLQACPEILFKKKLWRKCFPVNFFKVFRNTVFTEHLCVLLELTDPTMPNYYDN